MSEKKKLVIVGAGMAAVAVIEELSALEPDVLDITVFGAEPHAGYNRILLSSLLAGEAGTEELVMRPPDWYREQGVRLFTGVAIERIDTGRRVVVADDGREEPFDLLLLATGSRAFVPPIQGTDLPGTFTFRDLADTEAMIRWSGQDRFGNLSYDHKRRAVVVGGGLLGLEAARGLAARGLEVSVAHLMDRLMEQQLDYPAAAILKKEIEALGIEVLLAHSAGEICGSGWVEEIHFSNGAIRPTDMVVFATGTRPETKLARGAGLLVRRGIVVGDHMGTSCESVFAVGDCVEHRDTVYGLVEPLRQQAKVVAAAMLGDRTTAYEGTMTATRLKVAGVPLAVLGDLSIDDPACEELVYSDPAASVYRRLLIRDNRVTGAILLGDLEGEQEFKELILSGEDISARRQGLLTGAREAAAPVTSMPDTAVICGCMGVTKGEIVAAIREQGLSSREQVAAATRASTSCGGCAPLIEQILKAELGGAFAAGPEGAFACGCLPLSWEEARAEVLALGLKSVSAVLDRLGNGCGCAACKPQLNYMLAELWVDGQEKERSARFINDRFHANIQKDRTFSVVPRMYGGVTTPAELKRIADVAEKYDVPMVKITGGQRIDLLGVSGNDLPAIWADLDMPSGHAYAKAVRTCKTCVGEAFCRFGVQDSLSLGIAMEKRYQGIPCPAKVKMGVTGCPRNCAETAIKDVGVVGIQGGWELSVGGNGGARVRVAELLATVDSVGELLRLADAFLQYYRENARAGERTAAFVERLGIERLKEVIVEDGEGVVKRLTRRMDEVVAAWRDPWKESRGEQEYFADIVVGPKAAVDQAAVKR